MRIKTLFTALAILTMAVSATACASMVGDSQPRSERSSTDRTIPSGSY